MLRIQHTHTRSCMCTTSKQRTKENEYETNEWRRAAKKSSTFKWTSQPIATQTDEQMNNKNRQYTFFSSYAPSSSFLICAANGDTFDSVAQYVYHETILWLMNKQSWIKVNYHIFHIMFCCALSRLFTDSDCWDFPTFTIVHFRI